MQKVAAFVTLLLVAALADTKTAYFCQTPVQVDTSVNAPQLNVNGYGMDLTLFNAISFNGLYCPSGDIEGRIAVRNDVTVSDYSVGYELVTAGVSQKDVDATYSFVAGGNVNWQQGAIYPDGSNVPHFGNRETGVAGGSVTVSSTGFDATSLNAISGQAGLQSSFDLAQAYFETLSDNFAQQSTTGSVAVQYGGITFTCDDVMQQNNVFSIDAALFSTATYYNPSVNCNAGATYLINIVGTADVTFSGDNIHEFAQENIVFNVVGNGRTVNIHTEVDGSILAPRSRYLQPQQGVVKGLVVVADIAQMLQINIIRCHPPAPKPVNPCTSFEANCDGLNFNMNNVQTSFVDYNVISFGDFNAGSGDIEGRLAAAGNVNLGTGYSIGAKLRSTDDQIACSLVAGGDLTWASGELYPLGNGYLATGSEEKACVVGTTNSFLDSSRVVATNDLSSSFAAAQGCYEGFSSSMASQSDNVQKAFFWDGLFITCNDANAMQYFITLTASQIASFTYVVTDSCNFQANWVINVPGSDDVVFTGASFPTIPGGTICNVQGSRTVTVHDTLLACHLLAPQATLNQESGVIVGKVVVASVSASLQINRETTCNIDTIVLKPVILAADAPAGALTIQLEGANDLRVGDAIFCGNIEAIDGDYVTCSIPLIQAVAAQSNQGNVAIDSASGRGHIANKVTSSASSFGVAVAVFAVAALLI